jgi:hypothetical protein
VKYSGEWITNALAVHSGGTAVLSMDRNASVTLTFTGTAVKWIGYRDEWAGIAKVYLDGVLATSSLNTYLTPWKAQTAIYSKTGLASKTHTLKIVPTGRKVSASGGAWIWVDGFDVTN